MTTALKSGLAILVLSAHLLSCQGSQDQTDEVVIHIDPYWHVAMRTGRPPADHFGIVFMINERSWFLVFSG